MPEAKISVTIPEGVWVRDVSTDYTDTVFRVISALPGDGYGVGVLEVEGVGYSEALSEVSEHGTIESMEVLWQDDNERRSLIQIRNNRPVILQRASQSGIPIEMPFEIREGTAEWKLKASRESLSDLSSMLGSMGIEHTVEYVRSFESDPGLLTDKQHMVAETARELGYYDTPRETSLSEVAEELGIAKSTCSEVLHRAESEVMKEFLNS